MHKTGTLLTSALVALPCTAQNLEFEHYRLANGMKVILHEDHSLPVVCVNVWYHVGSKDERPGRSGFAHLFEHLMFMGTRRVPGASFDEFMEEGGGWNNASTSSDRTNYFSVGPSSLLPMLLWLEADRLEDFGRAMTQEKLNKQRAVVRNERRQTVEMTPYGTAEEALGHLLYPPDHPYHTSVIGSHSALEAATLQDVKDFFATFYVPNNASLVVAGDFDSKTVKALIAKWFGTLPRGNEVPRRTVLDAPIARERRQTSTDRVQFARVSMLWKTPAFFAPGDAEMDVIAGVLGQGKTSRLYKRLLYDEPLAVSVDVYQASQRLGSLFRIQATARPGVSLDRVERAIDEELDRFRKEGPTAQELARQKVTLETGTVTRLESLQERADALNMYHYHRGTPEAIRNAARRYRGITADSVRRWTRVLNKDARLVRRVVPMHETANPRDAKPSAGVSTKYAPPEPASFRLSNGIEVRLWHRPQLPLARVTLLLRSGGLGEPADKAGATSLMASMLTEGAGDRDALAFANAVDDLGGTLGASGGQLSVQVHLQVLSAAIDKTVPLLADAVLRPRFADKDWQRVRGLHLQWVKRAEDNAESVAFRVASRAFFGDDHPLSRPSVGTATTVTKLTKADVLSRYGAVIRPDNAVFFVAGDLTVHRARALLEASFGSWQVAAAAPPPAATVPPAPRAGVRVFLVDRPGVVQTVVRFMMPGPRYSDPARQTYHALNTILGGSFTSRLNQNIREKHGFSYGARSRFTMWPTTGVYSASASVQAKHTGASVREFLAEFRRIIGGDVTPQEAAKARATNRQSLVSSLEGAAGIIATAVTLELNDLDISAVGGAMQAISTLHASAINTLAKTAVPLDHATLVLVGDKKAIVDQLEGLGLPAPVQLDVRGDRVKSR
ncbi:MAG: peptidase M16 [Planctomycetes bacterium]|nr:peptidase M16 [Planctomycetota bacterium]